MFRLTLALAIVILSTGALAQSPPPAPSDSVQLQFPNADINTVLDFYEQLTGKHLIRPNQVLMGQIYIVINEKVPREEAIEIIEITLLANGFSLVPSEDGKVVKVFGNGVNPRTGGIPVYSDAAMLPPKEQVVTYLFKLKYADPADVAQTMQAYIAPSQAGYTSVVPIPKTQCLLVTENTPIIRGLIRVVTEIDLPPAEVISEFITLERADAKEVLEKLEKIFEKQPSQSGAPGAPGVPRPVRPAMTPEGTPLPPGATAESVGANTVEINAGSTLTEDAVIVGKIKLTADTRTNRIHVVTRPVNLLFIRTLIKEFDRNVPFGEPTERALKFVTAADVIEPVVKAIQDPGAKDDANGATPPGGQQNLQQQNRNTGQSSYGNSSNGSSGSSGFSEELQTQEVNTAPIARTVGNTRIIADVRSNKIIVLGNKEVKEKIFKLLDRLDVRAPQVTLSTVIGQLELKDNEEFGVNYIIRNGGLLAPITAPPADGAAAATTTNLVGFSGAAPTLNLANLLSQRNITKIATAGGTGLTGFISAGNSLDIIVRALSSTNRFRVSARPSLTTSNNKKAIIASGQEIAVPTQTLTSVTNATVNQDNTAVSSSIQYKKVALQLEVVPLINSEREVTLDILQKVDEISGKTVVGGNDIPTISTRYIKTTVSVPNESTLVLGGLIQVSDSNGFSGIPFLSKIPVLGALFRTTTKEKIRRELVILIRPQVQISPEESIQTREREQEYFKLEPDLEDTFYPKGVRKQAPGDPTFRQSAPPVLREKSLAPAFKK